MTAVRNPSLEKQEVFVDATAWIAIADASETHHTDAIRIYADLLHRRTYLVTIDLIIAEAQIWIRRRINYQAAMTFLERVNQSAQIEIIYLDASLEAETKAILQQYANQDFSFADAAAFALMRQRRITDAFTFDRHFITAGFLPLF